jgi:Ulp1 family protease
LYLALIGNELSLVQSIVVGDENESFGCIGDQPITRKDIRTLRGLTWLNDEVSRTFSFFRFFQYKIKFYTLKRLSIFIWHS